MATYKKEGDFLDLEIQLGDGAANPTTRVFARIEEFNGTVVEAEFILTNIGDGSYTDSTKQMTASSQLRVLYFIRLADGITESNFYDPNYLSEVFVRDFTAELIQNNLDAKVSGTNKPSNTLSAIVPLVLNVMLMFCA